MITRRDFLKKTITIAGAAVPLAAFSIIDPEKLFAEVAAEKTKVRWAFLVDTYKCVGCGFCVKACKNENEVPYDANVTRTWVERYVLTKDGKLFADSPKGARDGYTSTKIDLGMGRFQDIKKDNIEKAYFVPKLCNQCENPPCVQVCPVGATYQAPDGVRFFHPVYHTAEKCNFCYHRITKGMKTACVDACPFGARKIGNIKDPNDPVTKIIRTERVGVLKSEFGTKPQAFYIGLDEEVR